MQTRHVCLVAIVLVTALECVHGQQKDTSPPYLAMGLRVGEVTQNSAIIWGRVTANLERNGEGQRLVGRAGARTVKYDANIDAKDLEGAVPGVAGQLRLFWATKSDWSDLRQLDWVDVGPATDFTYQFKLTGLNPGVKYQVGLKTRPENDDSGFATNKFGGSFTTAAASDTWQDVSFSVVTGQAYKDLDHKDGYHIYPAMGDLGLSFIVPTGDTVYYDSERPRARTRGLARHHWHRMYSLSRLVKFHRHVPGYWEKDDHDTYNDDGWPGQDVPWMKPFTWEQGLTTFREQVPMGEKTYRTVRWGKGLQVWMVEGRDFRSANNMPDGPHKSIWGKEQLAWLQSTVEESDASFRVLISPTPIVGPDRSTKNDNHSNAGFAYEGNLVRSWAGGLKNFYVCCGDRHWQYMSVDPGSKLREFSCGPVSDQHAGGTPGANPDYQPFHRVKGGFLSVSVFQDQTRPTIAFRFHDIHGKVVYEFQEATRR